MNGLPFENSIDRSDKTVASLQEGKESAEFSEINPTFTPITQFDSPWHSKSQRIHTDSGRGRNSPLPPNGMLQRLSSTIQAGIRCAEADSL